MNSPSASESTSAVSVSPRWDAILESNDRHALERVLPSYVSKRRWFRTKTDRVQSARLLASFPLAYGTGPAAATARFTLVELSLEGGGKDTYVLPLAFVSGEEAATIHAKRPDAEILSLHVKGSDGRTSAGFVVDALALDAVSAALLGQLVRGGEIEDAGLVLRFHPLPDAFPGGVPEGITGRLVSGEQTNSSILYGEEIVGKVVRKLDVGESPDLEISRFLTAAGYANAPPLVGSIDVARAGESTTPPSTLAVFARYVPNQGDAWAHCLRELDAWLGEIEQMGDASPPKLPANDVLTRALFPLPEEVLVAVGSYPRAAALLGSRVGEMHKALSRTHIDAFVPEPLTVESREVISASISRDLSRVLTALGASSASLSESARNALGALRAKLPSIERRLVNAARAPEGGVRMRVHGDLHLGQVLFTGHDFALIDFEGEPARSLDERRSKRSPLVDVAGMMRSFHYAAVSALRARPAGSRALLAPWVSLWHRAVIASFLGGWLHAVDGTSVLPSAPAITRALLDLFLLEKCVYEIGYEMNNRPDWVDIPLEGLKDLLETERKPGQMRTSRSFTPFVPNPEAAAVEPSHIDAASPAVIAFKEGTATHAHALLGAHVRDEGYTDFAVWAPNALHVAVVGDFNAWSTDAGMLTQVADTGIYAGRVRDVRAGQRYKFRIVGADAGNHFDKADPFAVAAELSPDTASVITPLEYAWGDAKWMAERIDHARLDRPISIYEVHLGSWRRDPNAPERHLSYREIAAPLAAHAKEMGFTHVELMPLLEHPFYGSWGYGVTGFFAATSRYGTPADLMFLVDTLHQAGLGVIFDWVPAHFARDPHGLANFDGGAVFESTDPSRAVHPTWGTGLFDFARPEVRSFLVSSAVYWIEQFHADGIRVDGVESILYRDHGRAPGTWSPNEQGGRENLEGVAFLRQLTATLKLQHPEVVLAAEDSSAWPGVTRGGATGGLGFDLKWDMGFSHDMRFYLTIDPIQRSQHQGMLTFRAVYANNESFVLPLSHDDVIEERGGSLLQQMFGDPWQRLANLRALYAMTWAQPGKKLLFMGDEFAQAKPWHHDRALDWEIARTDGHDGIARLVGDLNRIYRELPALHAGDTSATGFEWIDAANADMSVVAFLRKGGNPESTVVVVCNFTPVPRLQYRVGVPRGGKYREVLNTDAATYGGSGHGNLGGVEAVPYPWNDRPSSIVVTLPPLGVVFFTLE